MRKHDPADEHETPVRTHGGAPLHAPAADAGEAYRLAYAAAQPDAGRRVVAIALEASEFDWNVAPGVTFQAWGFNGQVPGPTLEAEVGDVLEIRLTNRLPEPTIVHWHGVRVPAEMDGTEWSNGHRAGRHLHLPVHAPGRRNVLVPLALQRDGAARTWPLRSDRRASARSPPSITSVFSSSTTSSSLETARAAPGTVDRTHDGREGSTRSSTGRTNRAHDCGRPRRALADHQCRKCPYLRLSIGGRPFASSAAMTGSSARPQPATEILMTPADRVELAVGPFDEGAIHRVETLPYSRGPS